jgi:hypothetical protein
MKIRELCLYPLKRASTSKEIPVLHLGFFQYILTYDRIALLDTLKEGVQTITDDFHQ